MNRKGGDRRGTLEMYMDILSGLEEETLLNGRPIIMTHIACKTRMNYAQLRNMVTELIERGFIEKVGGRCYRVTKTGAKLLDVYRDFEEVLFG